MFDGWGAENVIEFDCESCNNDNYTPAPGENASVVGFAEDGWEDGGFFHGDCSPLFVAEHSILKKVNQQISGVSLGNFSEEHSSYPCPIKLGYLSITGNCSETIFQNIKLQNCKICNGVVNKDGKSFGEFDYEEEVLNFKPLFSSWDGSDVFGINGIEAFLEDSLIIVTEKAKSIFSEHNLNNLTFHKLQLG